MNRLSLAGPIALLGLLASIGPCTNAQDAAGYTFYVAPHSHIDIEWYWTYDQTVVMCINIMKHALAMMREDPRFTFTQDQMMAIKPFWESLDTDDKEFLLRMVKEGRFELASGTYLQPDEAESDFESLTRQLYPALSWMETTFSTKINTVWNLDTYGHSIQMPQLYRKAGMKYFVFMRDAPPALADSIKSPFYWEGPDGSQILSYWLSGSYSLDWQGMSTNIRRFVDHSSPGNKNILLLYGGDVVVPTETTAEMEAKIRKAAAEANVPVKEVIFSTPSRYFEKILESGLKLPVYRNEFNPPLHIQDLRGLYGERPASKMANRQAEYTLESAEKFSSIASSFGLHYPGTSLKNGWLDVIFNQDHDILPGSHTEPVEAGMMSRYAGALEIGRSALANSFSELAKRVDISRDRHYPFLVFNPLSYDRTELVRYTPVFKEELTNFELLDDAGKPVPFRTDFAGRREEQGPLSMAAIEFVAGDVPSMGYRLYELAPRKGAIQLPHPEKVDHRISTPFFDLDLDLRTGAIRSIVSRDSAQELLETTNYEGNELALQKEKDPDVEGMLHFTGAEMRGRDYPVASVTQIHDAIGTRVTVRGPFLSGTKIQEIDLYNQVPRIDFRTTLLGFPGEDGLLSTVFPLRKGNDAVLRYETHNAITDRPDGIYYGQTFVDADIAGRGVAFLNTGMGGMETAGGVLRLILLRSITHYSGYYAPGASEAGSHTFEYSLYAHAGDWQNGVVAQAHSFTSPLLTLATYSHSGSLPTHHSFAAIEQGNFEITALKRSEDGDAWILRGHETTGRQGTIMIAFDLPVRQVWLSDLTEKPTRTVSVKDMKIQFSCKPFEFVTFRLDIKE